jgi:23S rRNA pseudouridine1911/1915/1917 synthase
MKQRSAGLVDILYEDEDIIAVDKPEGLPTMAADGSRARNLYDIVTEHIRKSNPKGRAAIVHRLDRDTSGVVVFAKNARAKKRLMEDWDALVKERGYTALATGVMEGESGLFDSWLAESAGGQVHETSAGQRGSLRAITRWRMILRAPTLSLVELRLETGRKHQIRVQLSRAGHPVAGDPRYGDGTDPIGRLALHAHLLVLEHPFTGEILRFESPAPASFRKALAGASVSQSAGARPGTPHGKAAERSADTHPPRPEGRKEGVQRGMLRDDDGYRKRMPSGGDSHGSRYIPAKPTAK